MSMERFSERTGAGIVVFKDRIWVIAGEESLEWKSDVWSSSDGKEWTLENPAAPFPGRYNHQIFVFNDRLWVIGGSDDNFSQLKDIWTSLDGVTWEEQLISERRGFSPVSLTYVFKNRLWLAFGENRDLWSTEDGETWQLEVDRYLYPSGAKDIVECNEKLWLFNKSGAADGGRVWSSEDGIRWDILELDTSDFIDHSDLNVLLHKDEIWLFTYNPIDERALLWTSRDGENWKKKSGSIYFGNIDLLDSYLVVFDDQLFVVGGNREIRVDDGEEWFSRTDLNWVESAPDGFYSGVQLAENA